MNDVIRQKLKDLPQSPGVYIMSDASGTVIYVGKAVNLKNRVSQYFHSSVKTEKTMKLVENIVDFRYIMCATEEEALVLENNLIKKYAPRILTMSNIMRRSFAELRLSAISRNSLNKGNIWILIPVSSVILQRI